MADAKILHREHGDAGEGFIDFPEIDIGNRPAGLVEDFLNGFDRCGGEFGRRMGVSGMSNDPCNRCQAFFRCDTGAGKYHCSSAVGNRRSIGSGDRAVLGKGRTKLRDFVGIALGWLFVLVDDDIALAGFDFDRDDFVIKGVAFDSGLCAGE